MKIDTRTGESVAVIIVAAGKGERMQKATGPAVPKQFLDLAGEPILARTVRRMREILPQAAITVALPADYIPQWEEICAERGLQGTHKVCPGGATRFESVAQALEASPECAIIAVHDGVRPLFSAEMVRRTLETAAEKGSAIPVVEMIDSLREVTPEGHSWAVDRGVLRAVQTPQVFAAQTIRRAYAQAEGNAFTDDAAVVETAGYDITLCPGERRNIKITTPEDITIAQAWCLPAHGDNCLAEKTTENAGL